MANDLGGYTNTDMDFLTAEMARCQSNIEAGRAAGCGAAGYLENAGEAAKQELDTAGKPLVFDQTVKPEEVKMDAIAPAMKAETPGLQ